MSPIQLAFSCNHTVVTITLAVSLGYEINPHYQICLYGFQIISRTCRGGQCDLIIEAATTSLSRLKLMPMIHYNSYYDHTLIATSSLRVWPTSFKWESHVILTEHPAIHHINTFLRNLYPNEELRIVLNSFMHTYIQGNTTHHLSYGSENNQ